MRLKYNNKNSKSPYAEKCRPPEVVVLAVAICQEPPIRAFLLEGYILPLCLYLYLNLATLYYLV